VHAVPGAEEVGREHAVLAAAARHDDVVTPVRPAVTIQQLAKLAIPLVPVDRLVLQPRDVAGVTDAMLVEMERPLPCRDRVLVLDGGRGTLIGHHAAFAEHDLLWKAVLRFQSCR